MILLFFAGLSLLIKNLTLILSLKSGNKALEKAAMIINPLFKKQIPNKISMDIITLLPILMFVTLAVLLFSGFPVAFILGGVGLLYGFIGIHYEVFNMIEFFNIISRVWGGVCENLILVAIPMFIFMGTMLEKSGVAKDLLYALQILLRSVPWTCVISNNNGNNNGSNNRHNRCFSSYDDITSFTSNVR